MPRTQRQARRARIALATCARYPRLVPDDLVLAEALGERGIEAVPAVWDASGVAWDDFDGCVVRSVWDYPLEPAEFLAWARRVGGAIPLWNPPALIAWNLDKAYLRQLSRRGGATIPTAWLRRGAAVDLGALLAERGWERAVIKPSVDLGAKNLVRIDAGTDGQEALERLLARHDVMVQPFLPSLPERGELSLVFLAGAFSHAVRKLPQPGDFRVQPSWGGSASAAEPEPGDLALAAAALACLDATPLYARVDLVEGPAGESCLIELELIDPNLFFGQRLEAAALLARAIEALLCA